MERVLGPVIRRENSQKMSSAQNSTFGSGVREPVFKTHLLASNVDIQVESPDSGSKPGANYHPTPETVRVFENQEGIDGNGKGVKYDAVEKNAERKLGIQIGGGKTT